MIKLRIITIVVCLLSSFQANIAMGCKYNVRDVGFVDLGIETYYLYGYVSNETKTDTVLVLKQITDAVLIDSNIKAEIVNINEQKTHPALIYIDLLQIKSFPSLVLVSPGGRSIFLPVTASDQSFEQQLRSILTNAVSSLKQIEILNKVSETFGVVLLIEGNDPNETQKAMAAATVATEKINVQIKTMPKFVAEGPVVIVLERSSFATEKVLLWSLGLDPEKIEEPCAAVLYGKSRKMGTVLVGNKITERNLIGLLSVIGADCECGLDRKWLHGIMLPGIWDINAQAKIVKILGFDPENPMVKLEVSRILRRSSVDRSSSSAPDAIPSPSLGYQEFVVEFERPEKEQQGSIDYDQEVVIKKQAEPNFVDDFTLETNDKTTSRKPFYFLAALTALIVTISFFIVLIANRRKSI